MKNRRRDFPIFLTCIFAVFLAGFLLGRNYNHSEIQITSFPSSGAVTEATEATPKEESKNAELININTASVSELMSLPGIGKVTAQKIVEYRNTSGLFTSAAQLTNISGIGEKKLADIIDLITVG